MEPFKEEVIWVFSDERLPGIEVHNRGRVTFNIMSYCGSESACRSNIECFTAYEKDETYEVSYEFAKRQAQGRIEDLISEAYEA